MIQIDTFDKIVIESNTLVLSDIDETILFYDKINQKWWKDKIDYYMNKNKCDSSKATIFALDEWFEHIQKNVPRHTDNIGFRNLLENIKQKNSKLIFITARHPDFKQITEEHFNYLGLNPSDYKVHYLGGYPKGQYIKENINTSNYNNIIFIDDLDRNITSVEKTFPNNNKLITYKFIMKDMN